MGQPVPIKTHTFRGRKYRVDDCHLHGYAEIPGHEPPGIYVDSSMKGTLAHLETLIHEGLHAEDPDVSEQVIDRRGKAIARWVWRWGYRLRED